MSPLAQEWNGEHIDVFVVRFSLFLYCPMLFCTVLYCFIVCFVGAQARVDLRRSAKGVHKMISALNLMGFVLKTMKGARPIA